MNKRWVLDASALLALLGDESGSSLVEKAIKQGAVMSTVNVSEAAAKLFEAGVPARTIDEIFDSLGIQFIDFGTDLAFKAALLRLTTKERGLSLGDRACLALAESLGIPSLTADKNWKELKLTVEVHLIR